MGKTELAAPWVTYVKELTALFEQDKAISVKYDENNNEVKLYVDGEKKEAALKELLPCEKEFGNVTLRITVIPANATFHSSADLIRDAFEGNPALNNVMTLQTPLGVVDYAIFKKKVVQFYNDDLSDPHGYKSTLYENIARDVFKGCAVYFCTDVKDKAE